MRKSDKQNAIVIWTIVLCFAVTLGLCWLYAGEGLLNVSKGTSSETYYAIAADGYSDITLARSGAEIIKDKGGAGYVRTADGKIEVLYAVYPEKSSAESVLAKLGDSRAYVKEIKVGEGDFGWLDKEYSEAVGDALKYFGLAFDAFYKTSNALNAGTSELSQAKTSIDVLYARIDELKSVFYQKINGYDKDEITEIKLGLVTALALADNVVLSGTVTEGVSSIRYQLIQLVYCRQALMNAV